MRQPLRNGLLNAGHTCDTLAGDKSLTCLGADDGAPDMTAVADVDQTFFLCHPIFLSPSSPHWLERHLHHQIHHFFYLLCFNQRIYSHHEGYKCQFRISTPSSELLIQLSNLNLITDVRDFEQTVCTAYIQFSTPGFFSIFDY